MYIYIYIYVERERERERDRERDRERERERDTHTYVMEPMHAEAEVADELCSFQRHQCPVSRIAMSRRRIMRGARGGNNI